VFDSGERCSVSLSVAEVDSGERELGWLRLNLKASCPLDASGDPTRRVELTTTLEVDPRTCGTEPLSAQSVPSIEYTASSGPTFCDYAP
jgi:hypothetical protein